MPFFPKIQSHSSVFIILIGLVDCDLLVIRGRLERALVAKYERRNESKTIETCCDMEQSIFYYPKNITLEMICFRLVEMLMTCCVALSLS